ncbi:S8 family serine peptidase [Actinoallomurus sp. NPDC050550]|uniref:S8 family serine peptidase n=1 Tax=Actinoallomurus sp. NPDC050550 TaxID=3154937 RepID=UPI0033ECADEA
MKRAFAISVSTFLISSTSTIWANATRNPRPEEWWFGTWDIQNKVWPISKGQGVTVALIDTGVNAQLPDLRGKVLAGKNFFGPKGDGLEDLGAGGGHGTAMAALIVGQGTGVGMVGIAPEAKILSIRSDIGMLAPAIDYAIQHGADVINVSQGLASPAAAGGCEIGIQGAISRAIARNIVLVAAAGNDANLGTINAEPALCPGFLAVGAVDYRFRPWIDSQPAPYIAAAAPGVRVGSIGKAGTFFPDLTGTSSSSALTAGVAALVRSKYPKMSAREVVQRIVATAHDVDPPGRDEKTGYGLIRPYHALVDKVPSAAPNPVFAAWDRNEERNNSPSPAATVTRQKDNSSAHQAGRNHGDRKIYLSVSLVGVLVVVAGVFIVVRFFRSRENVTRRI